MFKGDWLWHNFCNVETAWHFISEDNDVVVHLDDLVNNSLRHNMCKSEANIASLRS